MISYADLRFLLELARSGLDYSGDGLMNPSNQHSRFSRDELINLTLMLCTGHANVVFGFKNCQSHAIRLEQRLFPMNPMQNSKQNQHDAQPTENGKIKLILNSGMASVVMQPCKIDS